MTVAGPDSPESIPKMQFSKSNLAALANEILPFSTKLNPLAGAHQSQANPWFSHLHWAQLSWIHLCGRNTCFGCILVVCWMRSVWLCVLLAVVTQLHSPIAESLETWTAGAGILLLWRGLEVESGNILWGKQPTSAHLTQSSFLAFLEKDFWCPKTTGPPSKNKGRGKGRWSPTALRTWRCQETTMW